MKRCENGHFYDEKNVNQCPYCVEGKTGGRTDTTRKSNFDPRFMPEENIPVCVYGSPHVVTPNKKNWVKWGVIAAAFVALIGGWVYFIVTKL